MTYHWCKKEKRVLEGFSCGCRDIIFQGNHPTFGIRRYYDQSLGTEISSEKQRTKVMRQQKVVDFRDAPSKNPIVHEATDKWKWRKNKGLA